ncbi:Uncharacterised protein [Salmonella enterica subsp. enterica serovar Bovismorbificans]|uniref:Uncharacterized protein n=1 Tax=Salmonella enterica subsp. enterica serovar Bovismorbificans TaxID=58097 RepID=A0A655DUB3_SALET|nr:Uncharacterised protein [Salmonella enterica subsp. enterica serovar Bovismorbificans]
MFRIGKIVFDERMAEIERSGPWIGAVTFFRYRQRNNFYLRLSQLLDRRLNT